MARLYLGNFDFEHQLAIPRYGRPNRLAALNAELAAHLLPLTNQGDMVRFPEPLPDGFLQAAAHVGIIHDDQVIFTPPASALQLQAAAWGWSDAAIQESRKLGCRVAAPPADVVCHANSRTFSHGLEEELEVQLPGAKSVTSVENLIETVQQSADIVGSPVADFRWVVKAEFGMAGRERMTGRGTALDESSVRWLTSRLKRHGRAWFEPWVNSRVEVSTQWDVPAAEDETPRYVGMTEVLCGHLGNGIRANGEYPGLPADLQERVLATARIVCERLQRAGYHGPLGVDAMVYAAPDGNLCLRPIQDINARWTMGRVALELYRRLNLTSDVRWLHVPTDALCRLIGLDSTRDLETFHARHSLDISDLIHAGSDDGKRLRKEPSHNATDSVEPGPSLEWIGQLNRGSRCLLTSPVWINNRLPVRASVLCIDVLRPGRAISGGPS